MKKILLLLLPFFLFSCTQEGIYESRFPGVWNISVYERTRINQDGTTEQILLEENAGTWTFEETYLGLYSRFNYNGSQGAQNQENYVEIAEGGQRLVLIGGTCINCDDAFNIESCTGSEIILTKFSPVNNGTLTYKLKIVLTR